MEPDFDKAGQANDTRPQMVNARCCSIQPKTEQSGLQLHWHCLFHHTGPDQGDGSDALVFLKLLADLHVQTPKVRDHIFEHLLVLLTLGKGNLHSPYLLILGDIDPYQVLDLYHLAIGTILLFL